MKICKVIFGFVLTFVILLTPAFAAEKKTAKEQPATYPFEGQKAWSYIRDLAADSMLGRKSGHVGGDMAAEYVAAKFKEFGLEPVSAESGYFQNFTISYFNVEEGALLRIINPKENREFTFGEDWRVSSYSGSANVQTSIVFAGYGVSAPSKGYDDYAGVNVKGKLVLIAMENPKKLDEKYKDEIDIKLRVKAAQEHGAAGVIMFKSETQAAGGFGPRVRLDKNVYAKDFVILSVENSVVESVFKFLPTEIGYLIGQIDETGKPGSYDTGVKAFVAVRTTFDEKRATRNTLAKITGSDKTLKDEYVILGAHMDHLGLDSTGEVYNGANDNASGTAIVMETARVMQQAKVKPKRTVIFAAWAGEESGLEGSKYYAEHPLLPLERTVANINLEMAAEGNGQFNYMGSYYGPEAWEAIKSKLPKAILETARPSRGGPGGSDHTSFLVEGVPGFTIIGAGDDFKYHQVHDVIELAKPEILKKAGDLTQASVEILANETGNFFPPLRKETYYYRNQNLVNFSVLPLAQFIADHKDGQTTEVDAQLVALEEKPGLSGDALFMDILRQLADAKQTIKKTKGLSLFASTSQVSGDVRQGKTVIIPGLVGISSFQAFLPGAEVLAKQGVWFVSIDKTDFLFTSGGLSDEGKRIVEATNNGGLLLFVKDLTDVQAKALLEATTKPIILLAKALPGQEFLNLLKKKNAAVGLLFGKGEDPVAFFNNLDKAKKDLGTANFFVANQFDLWGDGAKSAYLKLFTELIKAKWESSDMTPVFSGTLTGVLGKMRPEPPRPSGRPF